MRKLFKKALACCLVAALALTCFVGALSVSAETYTGTIVAGEIEVAADATTAVVPVVINAGAALNAAKITVAAEGWTVSSIAVDAASTAAKIDAENINGATFLIEALVNNDGFTTATVNVTLTAEAAVAAKVAITLDEVHAATWNEDVVNLAVTDGAITVKAAEPECDHAWVVDSMVPATAETDGSIIFTCSVDGCEETKTEAVKYEFDYYFGFTAAEYASQINLLFSIRKDTVLNLKGSYDDAYMYAEHTISKTGELKKTIINVSDAIDTVQGSKNRECKTFSYGLKSMQLTETVNAIPFVKADGVWYSGDVSSYSMRKYADERLVMADCNDLEKTLIVNMLTYGSKMQIFKDYNLENLADADLGDYASYVTTTDPVISATVTQHPLTSEVYIANCALDMADKIMAVWQFNADEYSGENKTDLVVKAAWNNANGVVKSAEFGADDFAPVYRNDGVTLRPYRYKFSFAELNSYDLRQEISINIYDGETDVSETYVASVEALINEGIIAGVFGSEEIAVYKAMMNYSDSSKAFFCK